MFITFEGIEGSGKSTQAKILQDKIINSSLFKNREILLTREPGGTEVGEAIRKLLLDKNTLLTSPLSEYLLYYSARIEHWQQKILPALTRGAVVICDRFFDSSIAYQAFAMNLGFDLAQKLHLEIIGAVSNNSSFSPIPDITILCDLSVADSFLRINGRSENNRYEEFSTDFHNKVRNGFLQIAEANSKRFYILDATQDVNKIARKVWQIVMEKLKSN
jgi:dTMP kinase